MISCRSCDHKEYRLEMTVGSREILQSMVKDGALPCPKCNKPITSIFVLKSKELEALRKKFPKKLVIYTKKNFGQLLAMPDDAWTQSHEPNEERK